MASESSENPGKDRDIKVCPEPKVGKLPDKIPVPKIDGNPLRLWHFLIREGIVDTKLGSDRQALYQEFSRILQDTYDGIKGITDALNSSDNPLSAAENELILNELRMCVERFHHHLTHWTVTTNKPMLDFIWTDEFLKGLANDILILELLHFLYRHRLKSVHYDSHQNGKFVLAAKEAFENTPNSQEQDFKRDVMMFMRFYASCLSEMDSSMFIEFTKSLTLKQSSTNNPYNDPRLATSQVSAKPASSKPEQSNPLLAIALIALGALAGGFFTGLVLYLLMPPMLLAPFLGTMLVGALVGLCFSVLAYSFKRLGSRDSEKAFNTSLKSEPSAPDYTSKHSVSHASLQDNPIPPSQSSSSSQIEPIVPHDEEPAPGSKRP